MNAELKRLEEDRSKIAYWKRWGPYLSERQWGTVREDYSLNGDAWDYFTHDQSRSRAYRWGEDGIAGISDNHQRLCFSIALWNGNDPIIKERLFGLTNGEGNHGEDVKEYYFYLDNTPTHSYMKYLYKYPQGEYPYNNLVEENKRRSRLESEYELIDTGIFDNDKYFDVFVEYAKSTPEDVLIRIEIINRGTEGATLHLLPTLWFRNTWSWDKTSEKPYIKTIISNDFYTMVEASNHALGNRWLYCEKAFEMLFTENESNYRRLFGSSSGSQYVKDGINDYLTMGNMQFVSANSVGTKFSPHYLLEFKSGESKSVRLRLCDSRDISDPLGNEFETVFEERKREAKEFYNSVCPFPLTEDMRNIYRQALAGMLWTKQFYYYVIEGWMNGDPAGPPPPVERRKERNHTWVHLYSDDILSMPDKWEYPWFASWDLAFHTISLAMIDPEFAKRQLVLLTREWYMHPNGQIPAYEWNFSDVNPPVHAWAAWRVYQIERKMFGTSDKLFLERVFQKLLLNFTWWVNRKDARGNNVFEGGFLGLDNIGIFDRSAELPTGGFLEQADGTSWMGMYCLNMLTIALELAEDNPSYEDIASKFFEHFIYIADAINKIGDKGAGLWDEEDGFYYDLLNFPDGHSIPIKVHSMVGLVPLFAVMTIDSNVLERLPGFEKRLNWFLENRTDLIHGCSIKQRTGAIKRKLLSIVDEQKLGRILEHMLDQERLLSQYGVRSVSKFHKSNPYLFDINGAEYSLKYEPSESTSGLFGGNSNWRGPIWFPVNYLIIESLQKFHYYFGDEFKVECPTGTGNKMTLWEVATELSYRLIKIFLKDSKSRRPFYGGNEKFQSDPKWNELILFNEYFHGDNGSGLGASHQTGWTGVVAKLIQQYGEYCLQDKSPVLFGDAKDKFST